ncbi:MAG TPA: hypothetical protein VGI19_15200 [Candidatus Cybelea sp.]|jgi:hypothetical protein
MIISSSTKYGLGVTLVSAMLAGCNAGPQPTFTPSSGLSTAATLNTAYHSPKGTPRATLYVSSWTSGMILGYKSPRTGHADKKNNPPTCTFTVNRGLEDIAADPKGNLIVPTATRSSDQINIYAPNCGALLNSIADPYGVPYDAAENASGTIVADTNSTYTGSVAVCTLKAGCTSNLPFPTNYSGQNMGFAVTINRAGDCWAQVVYETSSGNINGLAYFKGCSGTGQIATGFLNQDKGGLDIDKSGNIVALDSNLSGKQPNSLLYVYKGCNPACTLVGGPFSLHSSEGEFYGHVDKAGSTLATVDFFTPEVDIYHYTPTKVTYLYSITNGMSSCGDCTGAAYAPSITK